MVKRQTDNLRIILGVRSELYYGVSEASNLMLSKKVPYALRNEVMFAISDVGITGINACRHRIWSTLGRKGVHYDQTL